MVSCRSLFDPLVTRACISYYFICISFLCHCNSDQDSIYYATSSDEAYYAFKSPYYVVGQDPSYYHPDDFSDERFKEFLARYVAERKDSAVSQWSDANIEATALTLYKEYVAKEQQAGQLALATTSKPPVIKKENLKLIKKMLNAFLKKRPPIERLKNDGIIKG